MFVEPDYAHNADYERFWQSLRRGEFQQAEFKRIAKGGRAVWLQASYNPVFDAAGRVISVVKFATDITESKLRNLDYKGQIEAIRRVQGVIEFDLDGTIRTANDVFLQLMGYTLEEIRGKRHSIFIEPGSEHSAEYLAFWENLRAGRPDARVYKRFGKHGAHVWIQASYNPIMDEKGRPFKVVKYATDLSGIINQTESTRDAAQSVAAASEEMSTSIGEISRNMDLSRDVTARMLNTSTEAGSESAHLIESMRSMERIVGLIRDIAGRVNMLALNATIEAARAGEAGKGFAVVASEVKGLSDQTAKATQQIGQEISAVQQISGRVADSVQQTVKEIEQVMQHVNSVATAM
jgi:methyl-accepting chemotaxis protein